MQIKRFEAKTMTAALKMVKDEFGVNAVILSARSLREHRGLFGVGRSTGVEVTAANDSAEVGYTGDGPAATTRRPAAPAPPAEERVERRGLFQSLNDGLRSLAQRRSSSPPAPPAELTQVYQHLLAQDLEREVAAELIEQIQRLPGFDASLGCGDLRSQALRVLHDMGLRAAAAAPERGRPAVKVLVGPGGAGKTSMAIKLAVANLRRAGRRNGSLVSLDDQRIGAVEQLHIFGALLKVPVAVATSADAVRARWQASQSMDWLIVDTPGVSLAEDQRRSAMQQLLEPLKHKEVHLVLNACSREKDLLRTIDVWRGFPVDRLLFTRLDEAGTCGHLLNLLARTGLPLSDVGIGPTIPEDLAGRPLDHLLDRIWPAEIRGDAKRDGSASPTPLPPEEQRVANGSSELYHRSDCKWARKIKPEHLIRFTSAAEAESRQFVACRNCHPQRESRPGDAARGARLAAGGR